MKTSDLQNKTMNPETYKLRRKVIDMIYEIKELVGKHGGSFPRVEVRVTEDHERILGKASMGRSKSIIWITERAITASEFDLRSIVYHEVLHTVYRIEHNESCPLMKPLHSPLSKAEVQRHFLKYIFLPQQLR
jgi:hypothetical protein